ncbi:MAG: lytic transglycosylase domain-containing protein [Actinomycetota bacterium]|nr:lytic transglycosylase domain-containing protein [Actinomycetota bacterium]
MLTQKMAVVIITAAAALAPALATAETAPSSWQLRGQVRMRPASGLSDPRSVSGATDLLHQAACRRAQVLLADSTPPRSQVELVLRRQEGTTDETSTPVPDVDCDIRLMRTSAFRLNAWVSYPQETGKYVQSRRMTLGGAVELAANLVNRIGPRVLETGEEATIGIRTRTREKPVRGMIQGLSRRYGVDSSTAIRVAQCESGLNPRAYSPPYAGIFQQDTSYWPRRAATYGHKGDSVFDAYANVEVSLRMAAAQGWRHWGCA